MCYIQAARFLVPCGSDCCSAFLVHYSRNQIYCSELDQSCVTETQKTRERAGDWMIGHMEGMEGEGRGPRQGSYGIGW